MKNDDKFEHDSARSFVRFFRDMEDTNLPAPTLVDLVITIVPPNSPADGLLDDFPGQSMTPPPRPAAPGPGR